VRDRRVRQTDRQDKTDKTDIVESVWRTVDESLALVARDEFHIPPRAHDELIQAGRLSLAQQSLQQQAGTRSAAKHGRVPDALHGEDGAGQQPRLRCASQGTVQRP